MTRVRVDVLNGVNLDVLERRDPVLYGGLSLRELEPSQRVGDVGLIERQVTRRPPSLHLGQRPARLGRSACGAFAHQQLDDPALSGLDGFFASRLRRVA